VIWTFEWTYAVVYSVVVWGGHRTDALQTVQVDIHETIGHTLLFEYPLVNTWTYEVAFGSLSKNHQTYAPLAERLLLC
jgi:hypothetical protein